MPGKDQVGGNGNGNADALVLQYLPYACAIAIQYIPPRAYSLKQDLIQEGVVGLIQAARKYDGRFGAKFTTYMRYRVIGAVRDALRNWDHLSCGHRDKVRSGDAEDPLLVSSLKEAYHTADPAKGPYELVEQADLHEKLRMLVAALPSSQQTVVELYGRGLTFDLIGQRLGLSQAGVYARYRRAVERLRAGFERERHADSHSC